MDDSHCDFIQRCWLPFSERLKVDAILLLIQRFLDDCPPSGPPSDLFNLSSSQAGSLRDQHSSLASGIDKVTPQGRRKVGKVGKLTKKNQLLSGLLKRDDVVYVGALPAETGQQPSSPPAAGNQAHVDEEKEPVDAVNIKDLEPDDIVIVCVIKVSMAKTSDSCSQVSWVQQAPGRAR